MSSPKWGKTDFAPCDTLPDMGNNLKALRLSRGWTHDEAAEAMGISRGSFIKLERGERKLKEGTITTAAKAFGVAKALVIEGELKVGEPPPEFLGELDLKVFAAVEGGPDRVGAAPLVHEEQAKSFRQS
jgi:transcriptional regulator with XRE-family HTH domain